ncbi:MAG TPA: hypothetical protein VIG33_04535 [Pseudobdellovibrionaceae bacterium]|jgi:hypothetical protein
MKYLIFFSALVLPFCSFAETRYSVALGSDRHEILWLRQRKIQNKEVYLIGYQSPQKRQLEKVMPHQAFSVLVKEIQSFSKSITQEQFRHLNPFCQEKVFIENNNKAKDLCLDFMDQKEKMKLVQWVAKQSNVVIGID